MGTDRSGQARRPAPRQGGGGVGDMAAATAAERHHLVPTHAQCVQCFTGITSCISPWTKALLASQGRKEETEAQRGEVIWVRSHSSEWWSWLG